MSSYCGRFAPSATGPAHPGTLLAGLLSWLDARSQNGRAILRIEDLDPQRCSSVKSHALIEQIRWFGLEEWDAVEIQSEHQERHTLALQSLVASGYVYECSCSRATIKATAQRSINGGWLYPGTCRHAVTRDLESSRPPLRILLNERVDIIDQNGHILSQHIPTQMGDPVILRRDGAVSYLLAAVVDDAAQSVTHVVRGRDLAATTATQVHLGALLGYGTPQHRHHLLLMEPQGNKLAKFHGSVGVPTLVDYYTPQELCGVLAYVAGLAPSPEPCSPSDLLHGFSWSKVTQEDKLLYWDGETLRW